MAVHERSGLDDLVYVFIIHPQSVHPSGIFSSCDVPFHRKNSIVGFQLLSINEGRPIKEGIC